MFYTIYKTTNLLNNKFYIGKHQTLDPNDNYLGSGKLLKRAIEKHGRENFKKEILYIFDNEVSMDAKEKELVVLSEESYNLIEGGHGGFGYINRVGNPRRYFTSEERAKGTKNANAICRINKTGIYAQTIEKRRLNVRKATKAWQGNHHSSETKQKLRVKAQQRVGRKNSQYGTCWITNGSSNKKIKKEELDTWVQLGYTRGRI